MPYVPRGGKKFFDDKERRLAFYEIDLPELIEAKRDLLQVTSCHPAATSLLRAMDSSACMLLSLRGC